MVNICGKCKHRIPTEITKDGEQYSLKNGSVALRLMEIEDENNQNRNSYMTKNNYERFT